MKKSNNGKGILFGVLIVVLNALWIESFHLILPILKAGTGSYSVATIVLIGFTFLTIMNVVVVLVGSYERYQIIFILILLGTLIASWYVPRGGLICAPLPLAMFQLVTKRKGGE